MEHASCPVCTENYNNSTLKPVCCEYGDCNFTICKTCVRTYLLSTTSFPHCMQCKKAWSEKFIVISLNRSFVTKEYKTHRRTLLLDREISKLPETMAFVATKTAIKEAQKIADQYNEVVRAKEKELMLELKIMNNHLHELRLNVTALYTNKPTPEERRQFIMPCPVDDCRGFLSSQHKCGLCSIYSCVHCNAVIGHNKDDPHICNDDDVKSTELIKKETKPCPTCGTRIYKITGCDQMWCTGCHKAFSWKTGVVDTGRIHNPHFYQYQRENAENGVAPRVPGDGACNGLDLYYAVNHSIVRKLPFDAAMPGNSIPLKPLVIKLHRLIQDISEVRIPVIRDTIAGLNNFENERYYYIMKKWTKEELSNAVYRGDSKHKENTELLHIYELLSVTGIELFARLLRDDTTKNEFHKTVINSINEYNNLATYCNEQFKTISLTYNHRVPFINQGFDLEKVKHTFRPQISKPLKPKQGGVVEEVEVEVEVVTDSEDEEQGLLYNLDNTAIVIV